MSKHYTWSDVVDDGVTLSLPDGTTFDYVSDMMEHIERCYEDAPVDVVNP